MQLPNGVHRVQSWDALVTEREERREAGPASTTNITIGT